MTEEHFDLVTSGFPITTGTDGRAYLGCDTVIKLLRSIATGAERAVDEGNDHPGQVLANLTEVLRLYADDLECRAIAHTTEPK